MNHVYENVDDKLTRFLRGQLPGRELFAKETISTITILLTYQCPAACAHCIFESEPSNNITIDSDIARRYVLAAARQSPKPVLCFSGGEPFLQFDLMLELARLALSQGMPTEVISSSAWCKSFDFARERLAELQQAGLVTYATSVDRYHTPFVSSDKLRNGIAAALSLGMRVSINSMVDPNSPNGVVSYLSGLLGMSHEELSTVNINPLKVVSVGRAREKVGDYYYEQGKDFRESCPFSTEIVTLSPLGLIYPCCGMVLGEPPSDASLFIQDDISGKSIDEIAAILSDLKRDLLFRLLQSVGPYQLMQTIRQRNPDILVRDKYVGNCDVCLEFTRNSALADATRRYLGELSSEFLRHGEATKGLPNEAAVN